ncbi:ABC transporter substrate-binding protein [Actinoplanes palleronii]|uniref:ABC transporter substrate-binding protein n=1 Tax=Actinoplanes palleronii TaxID=113570 RepID=A0ABQ4BJ16_9ACTN|nr:extracellular solute-binding protein [Actinoplanes palleronii]GIE70664.1 ABC transporter substrate-binding protein [Actinoplanes palleronii]
MRLRNLLAGSIAGVLVAAVAACGGGESESGTTTLIVKTFNQFGYDELYQQYEAAHPGIKIKEENIAKLGDYGPKLQQWLAAGSGAGDVVALEEGNLVQFMGQPDKFVNLLEHGAGSLQGNFLEWKWKQALTADGKKLVGLGTDVGAQGLCYRTDLFAKAGLPTDREQVGALWPTWDDYLATGKKFVAAKTGAGFFDSAGNLYQNILMQQSDHTYYDTANTLVIDTNPAVKTAWDKATEMVGAGLSADIAAYSPQWNAGFKNGTFATIPCPSWMLATIEKQSGPENAGKWDVAKVPGNGAVRGGSFLAVPTQSKHQAQAAELAAFLTSPKGQTTAFKAKNNFPSSPQAIDDPAVKSFTNPYFSNAPVGRIFGDSVKALTPVYLGPGNLAVGDRVTAALTAVEQGKLTPDAAWAKALEDARRAG